VNILRTAVASTVAGLALAASVALPANAGWEWRDKPAAPAAALPADQAAQSEFPGLTRLPDEGIITPPGLPGSPESDTEFGGDEPASTAFSVVATNPAVHLGDRFRTVNVCVQSYMLESYWDITGSIVSWNTSDMNYWYRYGDGGCAGVPTERIVYVRGYTSTTDNRCAYVKRWTYTGTTDPKIRARTEMWINGGYPTCRDTVHDRQHVNAHEFGHAGGLSHNTFQSTVMNPDHFTYARETAQDEYYLNQLY
jgi:hypothetical protein